MRHRLILPIFGFFAWALVTGGARAAPDLSPQSTSASGVTVKATPKSGSGNAWEFEIVFDTHSQDLSDDLTQSAVLIVGSGARYSPLEWRGDPPGWHHRKGVLRFDAVTPAPNRIELRIQRSGEPSARIYRWQVR
ncbi:MAG: hypothetical protein WBM28_01690 [Burkholderiales bacterium]